MTNERPITFFKGNSCTTASAAQIIRQSIGYASATMSTHASDLTGVWQGLYTYAQGQSVPFTATLIDTGSHLSGATHEACSSLTCCIPAHDALLNGRRSGNTVAFEKTYDPPSEGFGTVHYDGVLSGDSNEIEGRWSIPGMGAGKFLMIRSTKTEQARTRGKLINA